VFVVIFGILAIFYNFWYVLIRRGKVELLKR